MLVVDIATVSTHKTLLRRKKKYGWVYGGGPLSLEKIVLVGMHHEKLALSQGNTTLWLLRESIFSHKI